MSREDDIKALLIADVTLMAMLTGGVFTSGALGDEGITRKSAPMAFDSDGYLKPCALVRQRVEVPDGVMADDGQQIDSTIQIVEVWFYQDSGYTAIDLARARTRV